MLELIFLSKKTQMVTQHTRESFQCCLVLSSVLKTLPCCILRSPPQIMVPYSLTLTILLLKFLLSFTLNSFPRLIFISSPINKKLEKLHLREAKRKQKLSIFYSSKIKNIKSRVQSLSTCKGVQKQRFAGHPSPFCIPPLPGETLCNLSMLHRQEKNKTLSSCG